MKHPCWATRQDTINGTFQKIPQEAPQTSRVTPPWSSFEPSNIGKTSLISFFPQNDKWNTGRKRFVEKDLFQTWKLSQSTSELILRYLRGVFSRGETSVLGWHAFKWWTQDTIKMWQHVAASRQARIKPVSVKENIQCIHRYTYSVS